MGENLKTGLRIPRYDDRLTDLELTVLKGVHDFKTVEEIADDIGESESTTYRILNGLAGKKQGVPKKYRYDGRYVERLPDSADLPIKFGLTVAGKRVVADSDIPTNSENGVEELPVSDDSEEWRIRPHYLQSKFMIRDAPDGWGRDATFVDREFDWDERVEKEMPDGSVTHGRVVFYEGHRIELYEKSVWVRWDFPGEEQSPRQMWMKYLDKMDEVQSYIRERFGVRVKSRPENIETSIKTQHWAHLDDMFAQMVVGNKEKWADDEEGVLWLVRNDRDEPVALVDASPSDIPGEPGDVELEWVHTQEAASHMDNVKDLLLWHSYYEITPQDYRNLAWFRDNTGMFDEIIDRLGDVDAVREKVEENRERIEEGLREVSSTMLEGFQSQGERIAGNREQIGNVARQVGRLNEQVDTIEDVLKQNAEVSQQQRELIQTQTEMLAEMQRLSIGYSLARLKETVRRGVRGVVSRIAGVFR